MLVRSPSLTSHKWRELVSSGVWFADVMTSFSGVTFVLCCHVFVLMLSLKPRPFLQSFFDMQAPRLPRVSFLFPLFIWRCRFFQVFFVPFPLSLCMESTSYVLSFRMVLFYVVTTGWIFDISLCENSINQSISESPVGTVLLPAEG